MMQQRHPLGAVPDSRLNIQPVAHKKRQLGSFQEHLQRRCKVTKPEQSVIHAEKLKKKLQQAVERIRAKQESTHMAASTPLVKRGDSALPRMHNNFKLQSFNESFRKEHTFDESSFVTPVRRTLTARKHQPKVKDNNTSSPTRHFTTPSSMGAARSLLQLALK